MSLALIDADIIAFQAAAANQQSVDWGEGDGATVTIDVPGAIDAARRLADEWTRLAGCRESVLCFSSREGRNFRRTILPTYKMNRKGGKPEAYWQVVDALEASFKVHRIEGLEADDVMGILSTSDKFAQSVVVTIDKDLGGVPCRLFNPRNDIRPRQVRIGQADLWWMTQTLTGDTTDGYSGCPKVGPKNAEKILGPCGLHLGSMWNAVVEAYEAKGLTEEDALVQARVARILRRSDYNREEGTIALWHPTTPSSLCLASVPSSSASTVTPQDAESPSSPAPSKSVGSRRSSSRARSRT